MENKNVNNVNINIKKNISNINARKINDKIRLSLVQNLRILRTKTFDKKKKIIWGALPW